MQTEEYVRAEVKRLNAQAIAKQGTNWIDIQGGQPVFIRKVKVETGEEDRDGKPIKVAQLELSALPTKPYKNKTEKVLMLSYRLWVDWQEAQP